jgi:hypothetical protein
MGGERSGDVIPRDDEWQSRACGDFPIGFKREVVQLGVVEPTPPPDSRNSAEASLTRRQAIGLMGGALALPLTNTHAAEAAASGTPAAAPPIPALPDLPNFHPMMEWLGREHAPRLSFLDSRWSPSSLGEWKRAGREVLRQRLNYAPKPLPLGAELVRREERADFHARGGEHLRHAGLFHSRARADSKKAAECADAGGARASTATADATSGGTRRCSRLRMSLRR